MFNERAVALFTVWAVGFIAGYVLAFLQIRLLYLLVPKVLLRTRKQPQPQAEEHARQGPKPCREVLCQQRGLRRSS